MSEARDTVLGTIRRSLGVTGREAPRRDAVEGRIAAARPGVIPARGQLPEPARVALFCEKAEASAATVARVASAAEVPGEVARFLRDNNLPATLRRGADPDLAAMPWGGTTIDVTAGPSDGSDINGLSRAFAAVAESGTLALVSGQDNPTSLNFLPDNHIVVVAARDVAGDYEAVLGRVRDRYGKGTMPRTLNFVTGPSRSADIEQTLILGAHGPRRLHIVVVDD
ncbi:LutC/YkgG family protein [Lichenibacterium ramalinae]|uniref:Lactate utilization protein n=1 Tax=Lichenibacterium ramalinae TaxID=2316527 RepID=A0A4Q2RJ13_9HYPH|nr:lactate utilization protein [Lichenibacterium ramalinae]RYB07055.1 lactate utilization protein [Lichenibacterium ramalinae]